MDTLVFRGQLTQALGRSIRDGAGSITNIPGLLQRALEIHAWEERIVIETGERFPGFPSFAAYVAGDAPLGLGSDVDKFEQLIEHNMQALDLYQEALQRPVGSNQHTLDQSTQYRQPHPESTAGILRRLKKDRPDLHARILANEVTAHAASIEAGYVHPRIRVPIDDMSRLAETLRKHLDAQQLQTLVQLITTEAR